jgi:hypothetical protein
VFSGPPLSVFPELECLGETLAVLTNLDLPFTISLTEVSHRSAACCGKGMADCFKLEERVSVTS